MHPLIMSVERRVADPRGSATRRSTILPPRRAAFGPFLRPGLQFPCAAARPASAWRDDGVRRGDDRPANRGTAMTNELQNDSRPPKRSRRTFLAAAAGGAMTTIVPRHVLGGPGF